MKVTENRIETAENVNEIVRNAEIDVSNYTDRYGASPDPSEVKRAIATAVEKGVKDFNRVKPKK